MPALCSRYSSPVPVNTEPVTLAHQKLPRQRRQLIDHRHGGGIEQVVVPFLHVEWSISLVKRPPGADGVDDERPGRAKHVERVGDVWNHVIELACKPLGLLVVALGQPNRITEPVHHVNDDQRSLLRFEDFVFS